MSSLSPARRVAFEALRRVAEGAHSDEALLDLTTSLEPRDAGLAYELVLGSLRRQLQLDELIRGFGGLDPSKLDEPVLLALRLGFYQLRFLERIPPHAAVAESVELVKRAGKRSAAGLVNAVLRKDKGQSIAWADQSAEWSMPQWLLDRWGEKAEAVATHALTVPPSGMDVGSQSIIPLLDIQEGHTFLDLCAAPGNKTRMALALSPSLIVACDRSFPRLKNVPGERIQLDATQPLPFGRKFDRILVDAPCSGTGTLARNPEIKWRVRPSDFLRQQKRQKTIVREALHHLAPGGRLVYSTCSLEPEENEAVVEGIPGLVRTVRRWPGIDPGDGFFAAIIESK